MDKLIEEIKKDIKKKEIVSEEFPKFPDSSYKPIRISKDNFHILPSLDNDNKIVFIDGGNAEIIKTGDMSLSIIRIYYSIFQNNKKIRSEKKEFFTLVSAEEKENKLFYKAKIFGDNIIAQEDLTIDSLDSTIRTGNQRINISKIAGVARRFAELKSAEKVIDGLSEEDIIVLDGSLQSCITNEDRYLAELYKKAENKGVIISAISKSCSIMTNKGKSLTNALIIISPKSAWYYYPIALIESKKHIVEIFFVKLHEKSKHLLKLEIYKKQKRHIDNILSLLLRNSKDPIFPGYPFGLIDADRFARVSNNEISYYKTLICSRIGKELYEKTAHDILDKISF